MMKALFWLLVVALIFVGVLATIVTIQGRYDVLYSIGSGVGGFMLVLATIGFFFFLAGGKL